MSGSITGIVPPPLNGQGTITATTTSAAINAGLSATANSLAFPAGQLLGPIRVKVQAGAAAGVYVSWLGGTASSTGCEYIAPGESQTKYPMTNMTLSPPSIVAVSGTVAVEIEW